VEIAGRGSIILPYFSYVSHCMGLGAGSCWCGVCCNL